MDRAAVGARIRAGRNARNLSLRQLASHVGVSASMLSLVENGKTLASVTTLQALVTELDISLDELFGADDRGGASASLVDSTADPLRPVHRPGERQILELAGGVTWERLSTQLGQLIETRLVTYPPGSSSSSDGRLTRHNGTEFAYIIEGELTLQLGYDTHHIGPGASISFESTTPHLYANNGAGPAVGVWFEVGRTMIGSLDADWLTGLPALPSADRC